MTLQLSANTGILSADNPSSHGPAAGDCIHHLFEQQAVRTPDRIALEFTGLRLTYRQLDERANQWARRLRSLGARPDTRVGICVERSLEMVVALYAVLKTGAAYVPLDPHFPAKRLALILGDAAPVALITQLSLAARCADFTGPRVWIDADTADRDTSSPDVPVTPTDAAYVIYTSGSTGRPKGVMVEHRSVVNFIYAMCAHPGITEDDVILGVITISFDISVFDWFAPLVVGARLVIAPDSMRSDGEALAVLIRESGATMTQATPSVWKVLLQAGWQGQPGYRPMLGGEAVSSDLARELLVRCDEIWNCYGPTETTVYSTAGRIENSADIHIGRPIAHTHLHIVDESLRPVEAGTEGELLIGGRGLARGYLNQPELTAERFIRDPFSTEPGARLYRTGDLCRLRPDGNIDYLGRIDTQVKLNGFRIELGEIEAALRAVPGVSDAVVVLLTSGSGEKHLSAFFIVSPGSSAPADHAFQAILANTLPGYMIPSRFTQLEALPLTPNGKIDRRALTLPAPQEAPVPTGDDPSPTDLRTQLGKIWKEVLRREHVDVHDNFFDLGGHSLLAVLIGSRLSQRLGRTIPLRWIFEYPTIDGLHRHLQTAGTLDGIAEPITRQIASPSSPASFSQQGMWLLHQLLPQPAAYNVASAWLVSGPLDRPRLVHSLQTLLARHDILRTSLDQQGDRPEQHVATISDVAVPWREVDATTPKSDDPFVRVRTILNEEKLRPFDLSRPPLWRAICITCGDAGHVVAFVFHHSIIDEWSLGLFNAECSALYAANGSPDTAALPAPALHYADYAAWQRRQLTDAKREHLEAYWRTQLADLPPPLELPCALPRPDSPSGRGASHSFTLSGPVATGLRRLARAEKTTLFTVVLTALQVWLYRVTGQNDVLVGTPMTRRTRPELMTLLGFFLNTLPVRTRLEGDLAFTDVLQRTRTAFTDAVDHSDLPFEQIVALAAQPRTSAQSPLHQIMFVLTEELRPALRLGDADASAFPLDTSTCKNDFTLFIEAESDPWNVRIEYATDLFDAAAIARMAAQFARLLESLVATPALAINRLPLLPEAEYRLVVETWNHTATPYPRDRSIHALFEEQAALTPDAPAVACGENVVTYRELNDSAARIAGRLRTLGVTSGSLVALSVERSPDCVAAILGILKAGGAYWALEDNIPAQRLRLMLADARPAVLIARDQTLSNQPEDLVPVISVEALLASPAPSSATTSAPSSTSTPSPASPPAPASRPEDPAYVNYTSGSTGQPKGVLVPHRAVVRLVRNNNYVTLTAQDTLLHHSPLSFDASTFELWGALLNGACVALAPPGRLSLSDFGEAIRRHRVTTMFITTGLFHLIVDEKLDALQPLRQLLTGGDVLSPAHIRKCRQAFPHLHLVAAYGPTENTTFTSCHTVTNTSLLDATVAIGRPIANTQVYVLDPLLQPVPAGVTGELYTGGDGLALGYLNQPQLTAERFIPDPFHPGARLYRTGDGARWRADGELDFMGRMDSQVKIRGFRVEPGEIEAVLREARGVRAVAVLCRPNPAGGKWIVAYVVADPAAPANARELKSVVRAKLPDYMVPSAIEFLPALPLNRNGKIDHQSLPDPRPPETTETRPPAPPPRSFIEGKLVKVWQHLFRRENISIEDNFFDLGGHSLLATRLALEIEKLTGQRLPIALLLQAPTIAQLSALIYNRSTGSQFTSLVTLQPQGNLPALFCIHGWGGDVYTFLSLARKLAPERPVFGLQAVTMRGGQSPHSGIEAMAAHYAAEIRRRQAHGPYHLAGYSMGGWIAYAVASELTRQGAQVGLLALIETNGTVRLPFPANLRLQIALCPGKIYFHLKHSGVYVRRYLAAAARLFGRPYIRNPGSQAAPSVEPIAPNAPGEPWTKKRIRSDHSYRLVARYRPPGYSGRADLFVGDEYAPDEQDFWKSLIANEIIVRKVKGKHLDLLNEENTSSFSLVMRDALRHAENRPHHG